MPITAQTTISRRTLLIGGAATATGLAVPSLARAADAAYPERPITFICPWPAGGTADHVEMAERDRVERARVKGVCHAARV